MMRRVHNPGRRCVRSGAANRLLRGPAEGRAQVRTVATRHAALGGSHGSLDLAAVRTDVRALD